MNDIQNKLINERKSSRGDFHKGVLFMNNQSLEIENTYILRGIIVDISAIGNIFKRKA